MSFLTFFLNLLTLVLTWPALLSIAVGAGLFATWYRRTIATRARVLGSESTQSFLLRHVPALQDRVWPTWWACHALISTVGRALIQKQRDVSYRREILTLGDGGTVALDWSDPPARDASDKTPVDIVLILPGIAGSSDEGYTRNAAALCTGLGYRSVVFNNRGQGGITVTSPRVYNAACCEDLCEVVVHVQSTSPASRMAVVGFSMGGMISSHFFGMYSRERKTNPSMRDPTAPPTRVAECNVIGGMGLSMPWDPIKCRVSLESTVVNRGLNRHITNNLHKLVQRNSANLEYKEVVDSVPGGLSHICKSDTISEFDQRYIVPSFGFSSLHDYYNKASPERHISDINIPVLYVHAADDMFMPGKDLPEDKIATSNHCGMVITKWGGHLGFLEGSLPRGDTYCEKVMCQYVTALFNHSHELQR